MASLLRSIQRKASLEGDDIAEILKAEFEAVHTDISSYRLDEVSQAEAEGAVPAGAIRLAAEHAAGSRMSPPKRMLMLDLAGLGAVVRITSGATGFEFADRAHRDLDFLGLDELRIAFLQAREEQADRLHRITKAQLGTFVRTRVAAGDPEWLTFFSDGERSAHWVTKYSVVLP
jgi:hypothetical protein